MEFAQVLVLMLIVFVFCYAFRINPVEFATDSLRSWREGNEFKETLRTDAIDEQAKAALAIDLPSRVFQIQDEFSYVRLALTDSQRMPIDQELERLKLSAARVQLNFERVQSRGNPETQNLSAAKLRRQIKSFEGVTPQVDELTRVLDAHQEQIRILMSQSSQPSLQESTNAESIGKEL